VLQLVEAGCAPAPATAFPLASLGGVKKIADNKTRDLTMEQIKDVLEKDLRDRQYFVTAGRGSSGTAQAHLPLAFPTLRPKPNPKPYCRPYYTLAPAP
jgi:hypothetical protein